MTIPFKLNGIPCQIRVVSYLAVRGNPRFYDNPLDYEGYVEMEYGILDRRGYPAPWLERKVTPRIDETIREAVIRHMGDEA